MKRAFWLKELGSELAATEAVYGDIHTDVAIIGGGFVGLWTALQIIEKSPETRVTIIEKDVCGAGASGRNGGFVLSWWPKISSLISNFGKDEGIRLATASAKAGIEIGEFCDDNGIDAHYQRNGWLWTATTSAQLDTWKGVVDICEKLGHSVFKNLTPEEVKTRTGSPVHLGGVLDPNAATVQPARLVSGLRRVALERGIQIFENTPVNSFDRQCPVNLMTPGGRVTAKRVVIATNAWAAKIPELSRLIVPVTSTVLMTEAIPERLSSIGWTGGEGVTDSQLMVNYYRTTRDGRIAFGKGTGGLGFGSNIGSRFDFNTIDSMETESDFRRVYPMLRDVKVECSWSGAVDRTYDSLPVLGALPGAKHIFYGIGWSGNGVGPSRIGGKILSSLALGLQDEWSQCGLVERKVQKFPPEPIRYMGGSLVRGAVQRKERAEAAGVKPRIWDKALVHLAPTGLEDKSE